eukprot:TRINITY_DN16056_c0_g1_i1.p1 TRINITY_DN16056_c0_g1~~TRINITY_DN16056_c0_g1_i1.p1  ORF type:complete len:270 (-),score=83.87 TRINITY_DN16056_c0_g1_i1:75-884(-)
MVLRRTNSQRVALYMADGGFSVEGEENLQEVKLQRLILCQFLAGLLVLRPGGFFLCKIFDVFTPFTAALLHILYTVFDDFALIKPVTSRPANSERYVVCRGLKTERPAVVEHLFTVNRLMGEGQDVREIMKWGQFDPTFVDYVKKSNMLVGEQQVTGLEELVMYIEDRNLAPRNQEEIRDQCLALWKLPDTQPKKFGPEEERRVKWPRNKGNWAPEVYVPAAAVNSNHKKTVRKRMVAKPRKKAEDDGEFQLSSAAVAALARRAAPQQE